MHIHPKGGGVVGPTWRAGGGGAGGGERPVGKPMPALRPEVGVRSDSKYALVAFSRFCVCVSVFVE